jgi:hypothetical protein
MKKSIFKVGDKVFDIRYGWGIVEFIDVKSNFYPINVSFGVLNEDCYTWDGRSYQGLLKVLSFTEYTLEGFSQERPEELPKKGQIVWVKDDLEDEWRVTHFISKIGGFIRGCTFFSDEDASIWNYMTTENPYKDE